MTTNMEELLKQNSKLCQEVFAPAADDIDQKRRFPRENVETLGRVGMLGLVIPKEFGGAGGGIAEMAQALDPMAQACPSTAMVALMHYCGSAVITAKAPARLKQDVLPAIARGRHLTTLAFSEAGSGGHFYMPVSQVTKNGHASALTARKSFVTSAGEADSYVVSTRRANAANPLELDLYLIARGQNGFVVERPFEGLGLAGNASAPMRLEEVILEGESRLGDEGTGFKSMLEIVLPYFQIGVAAVSLGIATSAFQAAMKHVSNRRYEHAGGATLAVIPRVQFLAAEMVIELRSARAYLEETIRRAVAGDGEAMLDTLGVKARAAEASLAIASRAMTLGGGSAYGRRGGLERIFRDAQAVSVMAPTTDVLKEFVGKACLGLPLF